MSKKAHINRLFVILIFIIVIVFVVLFTKNKGDLSLVIEDVKNLLRLS